MRIQSIGIFANPNNEGALAAVSSVYGVARSRGIKCFIDRSFANMEEFSGYETIQEQVPGLMIAIGGDGTILKASKYASVNNKPLLGINTGRLGFMASMEADELDSLSKLKTGDYTVADRIMLDVSGVQDR
mgnify:CR=1 FL=1